VSEKGVQSHARRWARLPSRFAFSFAGDRKGNDLNTRGRKFVTCLHVWLESFGLGWVAFLAVSVKSFIASFGARFARIGEIERRLVFFIKRWLWPCFFGSFLCFGFLI
jgi:hypothetical protein